MDRDDIKLLKQPYASTHHPQPNANPPVPDYTNALHVGKLLQLQQWPTCTVSRWWMSSAQPSPQT